jgi:hypothetical protein
VSAGRDVSLREKGFFDILVSAVPSHIISLEIIMMQAEQEFRTLIMDNIASKIDI